MSSSDMIQPEQLKLFMTGTELRNRVNFSMDALKKEGPFSDPKVPVPHDETLDDMWARKVEESKVPRTMGEHGSGTYESIDRLGWRAPDPVTLRYETGSGSARIGDAHHRIAAAADIEAQTGRQIYIPVEHTEDIQPVPAHYRHTRSNDQGTRSGNTVREVPIPHSYEGMGEMMANISKDVQRTVHMSKGTVMRNNAKYVGSPRAGVPLSRQGIGFDPRFDKW